LINDPAVTAYLSALEPEPDPLLLEMRKHGERDHIPIVHDVTGGLLEVLAAATNAKRAVEVGTAIGVSTLHLREAARTSPPSRSTPSATPPRAST
jgi:predicted O-methyltransferase YrrM